MHSVKLANNKWATIARGAQRVEVLVADGTAQYQFEGVDATFDLPVNAVVRIDSQPNEVLQLRGSYEHGFAIVVYRFY